METLIAASRPNGDRLVGEAVAELLRQGATPQAVAQALAANGIAPEVMLMVLRAAEVPPGTVVKALHAVTTDPTAKASLNSLLMSMGVFGPTLPLLLSPAGAPLQVDASLANSVVRDVVQIGVVEHLGDVARVLVNAGATADSLALALVNQGVPPAQAIAVMQAATLPPAAISASLYAAVPSEQVAAVDAAALAAGIPLQAPAAGPAAAPAQTQPPVNPTNPTTVTTPFVSSTGSGGGSASTASRS
ncbi:hypothetical protein ISF6_2789 [Piscinibacter sakaiensis]|uniref:Uncharacterized protein n=2 Tax=Piscinibacter sakaiensis TaxID=1547922 RepID=A0A0K8NU82_PISS1|nr:hypothetical protein ISF6_2789 [Piscinibacter sakaiensis]